VTSITEANGRGLPPYKAIAERGARIIRAIAPGEDERAVEVAADLLVCGHVAPNHDHRGNLSDKRRCIVCGGEKGQTVSFVWHGRRRRARLSEFGGSTNFTRSRRDK
jgi:hypothetical protein